jgi:hypothetical protein
MVMVSMLSERAISVPVAATSISEWLIIKVFGTHCVHVCCQQLSCALGVIV